MWHHYILRELPLTVAKPENNQLNKNTNIHLSPRLYFISLSPSAIPQGSGGMAGYVAVHVDPQADPPPPLLAVAEEEDIGKATGPLAMVKEEEDEIEEDGGGLREDEPLISCIYECRICQDEDNIKNLESPCGCSGSLKYAHRKCVQYWCNEKGDTTCEICHKPYQPGYTSPPRKPRIEETAIDIHGRLAINVNPLLDMNDPRLLAMPDVDHRFLESDYDEYPNANIDASGAELCRSATFILMAILLLRHIFTAGDIDSDEEDDFDLVTFFGLFFLKVAAFLLPCYIMAWTITLIARQRERRAAAASTTPFALVLQSAHAGDLHLRIATPPHLALPQEPQ